MTKRRRRSYTVEEKLDALDAVALAGSLSAVSDTMGVPVSTLSDWGKQEAKLREYIGSKKRKTLPGSGRPEMIPFSEDLVEYMRELRDDEKVLSSYHMMGYMKANQRELLDAYLANSHTNDVAAYNSLLRLCQRFAHRHGFSMKVPSYTKEPTAELLEAKAAFSKAFWSDYATYRPHEIINVDETSVYFDTPPKRIWAVRGGSSKIDKTEKHSDRITVVVTVRADGKKLPILFIVKGKPGGWIEKRELGTYPDGHCYAVQANAWMDARVWKIYVQQCLAPEVEGPSVLLLDNFDVHVSDEGQAAVVDEACCAVCPLPANATSVCQPLDVGVMGPLKARYRSLSLWLREESTAKTAKEKRLSMIERTIRAYEGLEADTISASFEKAIPRSSTV